ncbi:MAG: FAD-dependent oxidoreductase [Desulfobulbus sp.]|jgi:thioredoxin reductase (NADPH)|uniref:FAD-dependent oxidoreductase n=1 Tax=Desulfobulbus sp. TaxID=895 RepID=UPI002843B6DC|nr:FAD-dependent oxidoreductase [Desulfobulbus sp.]MDR2549533.1 FAD-dependent oxidoreductase [Desulfobulbus sp.]
MAKEYDLLIIGGGPGGLAAAIYGGRAKLNTLVINKGAVGGLATTTREIVNYPGYVNVTGPDLMKDFKAHAESFGVEFLKDEVVEVDFSQEEKSIRTKKKKEFQAKAVIIACGSEPRLLDIPGERRLRGSGVAYCATCDAECFEGEDVVVIGSGDQAIEEGMYVTKYAKKVTVIVLHDEGILDCNKVSAEKALAHKKMEFIWNSTVEEVIGDEEVDGVKIKNIKTGDSKTIACKGIFFWVGMVPSTKFINNAGINTDQRGYILTNEMMETSVDGVYAVGDNRVKYLRQIVSAAGDGATAAVAAERYIDEVKEFNDNISNSEKTVLLVFFDPKLAESLEFLSMMERVNGTLNSKFNVVKIDVSMKKNLFKKYGVTTVPAIVAIERGNVFERVDPALDESALLKKLECI